MEYGKRLKLLREEKGFSQEELGKVFHLSQSIIAHYEAGRKQPSFQTLNKLADYFGVSVDYLLGRTDIPRPEEMPPSDYSIIYQQRDEGDAYLVVRQMEKKYHLSKDTVFKMIEDIARFYENRQQINLGEGRLADGPKSPGSGVFDDKDDGDGDT